MTSHNDNSANSRYLLEIHRPFDDGTPEGDVSIEPSTLSGSELIGCELTEIFPDDLGDMFRFKLKDGRKVTLIQGIEEKDFYFIEVRGGES